MAAATERPAILALADGAIFRGQSVGYPATAVGEAVFNTAMTGYQEILTDPSYHRQIVALTHPHIGNTGVNPQDGESARICAAGLAIRALSKCVSNWRASIPLADFLHAQKTPAIAGIDTRKLARRLRDHGAQGAAIVPGDDEQAAIQAAQEFAGLSGAMLAAEVGAAQTAAWREGRWRREQNDYAPIDDARRGKEIVVLNCGVKRNILRELAARIAAGGDSNSTRRDDSAAGGDAAAHIAGGKKAAARAGRFIVAVAPYPADSKAIDALLARRPAGVVLSNGPGDPQPCESAVALARRLLAEKIPTLGICLGHQILALALGAQTVKMKFGHHGANHPVRDLQTGQVLITSQNHGFAVDAATLPKSARITHISLFDQSLQGFRTATALSFQGHPESSPGPHDAGEIFERFLRMIERY